MAANNTLQQTMPIPASFSDSEILSALIENGMVDADGVQSVIMKEKEKIVLKAHTHDIWKGKDGRWKTYIDDENGRRQISRSSKSDLTEYLYQLYLQKDKALMREITTMESFYDEWIEHKKVFVSDSSIKRYQNTWNAFYRDADIVKKPLRLIEKEELERWLMTVIRSNNMNFHQYETFTVIVRQMFEYAEEIDIIDRNVMKKIRLPLNRILRPEIKPAAETQVFFEAERLQLIDYAFVQYKKNRDTTQRFTSLAIAFLLYASLRRGEIVALRFDDIRGNQIVLKDSYSHGSKKLNGRLKDARGYRIVYAVPQALEIIEMIRDERIKVGLPVDGFIFTVDERFGSLYSALGKMINKYCEELGIPNRSLHKTRKTCASMMRAEGVDDLVIQGQLGHKDIKTTYNCYCYDMTSDEARYAAITKAMS